MMQMMQNNPMMMQMMNQISQNPMMMQMMMQQMQQMQNQNQNGARNQFGYNTTPMNMQQNQSNAQQFPLF